MNTEFRYKMLKQKASQEANPEALRIIKELEKQQQELRCQIKLAVKKGGAKTKSFARHKIDYSELETTFAGWVYRELQA